MVKNSFLYVIIVFGKISSFTAVKRRIQDQIKRILNCVTQMTPKNNTKRQKSSLTPIILCILSCFLLNSEEEEPKAVKLEISTKSIDFGTIQFGQPCTHSLVLRNPVSRPASIRFDVQKSNTHLVEVFPPAASLNQDEFASFTITLTAYASQALDMSLSVIAKCLFYFILFQNALPSPLLILLHVNSFQKIPHEDCEATNQPSCSCE